MKPQIHADLGFKSRAKVFIDTPLLHFLEDEFFSSAKVDGQQFYEVLSELVEEFGSRYRNIIGQASEKLISEARQITNYRRRVPELNQASREFITLNIIPGEAQGIRDEYCCYIPACILDVLVTTYAARYTTTKITIRAQSQQHGGLLNSILMRCQELTGIELPDINVGILADNAISRLLPADDQQAELAKQA